MIENYLTKAGFEPKEVEIYLACLEGGENTPASLVKQTGVKRSTVYFYLGKLREKGLISYKVRGKRKYILARDPEKGFESFIYNEEEKVNKKKKAIKKAIPKIKEIKQEQNNPTQVSYLEGPEGVRILLDKIIKEKKDIHWIGCGKAIISIVGEGEFYRSMTLRRLKQGTTAFAITDEGVLDSKRVGGFLGKFRRYCFLNGAKKIPAILIIFGDYVAILSKYNNDARIVLVKDVMMTQLTLFMFESLWGRLKEARKGDYCGN